jgi:hypothetical protein
MAADKKRGTSVKGNISNSMRHSYDADCKAVVMKCNNCEPARKYTSFRQMSEGGSNRSRNLRMSILHENHSVAQNTVTFMK